MKDQADGDFSVRFLRNREIGEKLVEGIAAISLKG